jgi:peptidoglycan-N-acetylglucosamine deacetylase
MTQAAVTTSWDDGHKLDLKVAELLTKYGLPATFYVALENQEIASPDRLTPQQVRDLGKHFEIGAHTLTHPVLTTINDAAARREIEGSKNRLEELLGRPVTTFCAPRGAYNQTHVGLIRAAGFTYARTTRRFALGPTSAPLEAPTTIHAYRHWSDLWPIIRTAGFQPARALRYLLNWDELAIALFERAVATGGVFHLWGHSWEVDRNHDWARLERVFAHIAQHKGVRYVANGELV